MYLVGTSRMLNLSKKDRHDGRNTKLLQIGVFGKGFGGLEGWRVGKLEGWKPNLGKW